MKMPLSYLKCSLVGDACVGKTRLTKVFVGEKGDDEYTPTIFENYYGKFSRYPCRYTNMICSIAENSSMQTNY